MFRVLFLENLLLLLLLLMLPQHPRNQRNEKGPILAAWLQPANCSPLLLLLKVRGGLTSQGSGLGEVGCKICTS